MSPSDEVGLIGGEEKRDIKIVPYNSDWPLKFEHHKSRMLNALGSSAVQLEHIGSTAVPALAAKPIIDMLLVVKDSSNESSYLPTLEGLGYVLRVREPDFHEHRMFRTPELDVHLHVYSAGSTEVERYITFRDRLRSNLSERKKYAQLKSQLATQSWDDMNEYANAKSSFIEETIERAGY